MLTRRKKIDILDNIDITKIMIQDDGLITKYDHDNKTITFIYKHDISKTYLCNKVCENSNGYIGYKKIYNEIL